MWDCPKGEEINISTYWNCPASSGDEETSEKPLETTYVHFPPTFNGLGMNLGAPGLSFAFTAADPLRSTSQMEASQPNTLNLSLSGLTSSAISSKFKPSATNHRTSGRARHVDRVEQSMLNRASQAEQREHMSLFTLLRI